MSSKSVFLVANPTHYINALEAIDHYKDRFGHKTLIVISEYIDGINNIDNTLNHDVWDERHFIDLRTYPWPASDYRTWKKCFQEAKSIMSNIDIDLVVTGNLRDTIFYALILKQKKRIDHIIALDDGTPSISILNSRATNNDYMGFHIRSIRVLIKALVSLKIFFPFHKPIKQLEFFSIFQIPANKEDIVVRNELNTISTLYSKTSIDFNKVYFIGSHIVDKGLVSKQIYLRYLKCITDYFSSKGKDLYYITHRGESNEMLDEISDIVPLKTFNVPLEFAFIDNQIPCEISGYFSSALFTLRKIHSNEIRFTAFKFEEEDIIGSEQEPRKSILAIYQALQADKGINLITENDIN